MQVHVALVALQSPGVVSNALYRGDVIFREQEPVLVLEWSGARGESEPAVCVALQRQHLLPAGPQNEGADWIHEHPVTDPRPRQSGHG